MRSWSQYKQIHQNYQTVGYRARASPRIPAMPAIPAATPPVAIGAPPVEVEDEGAGFLEPEALDPEALGPEALAPEALAPDAPVVVEAAVLIVEAAVLCAETPVAGALEEAAPTAAEVGSGLIKLLSKPPSDEAQAMTLLGSLLYQAGMVPAMISLSKEERYSGCRMSV